MKKQVLSEELLRMKRLAGIISESQYDENKLNEDRALEASGASEQNYEDWADFDDFHKEYTQQFISKSYEDHLASDASKVAPSQNKFTPIDSNTYKESMIALYGDADDYPSELNSIKFKFIGTYDNFAITQDGNVFNVYTWHRILDGVKNIGSFDSLEAAKEEILSKNKKPLTL